MAGLLESAASATGKNVDALREARMKSNPAGRFGSAVEFGATCAFLCSIHAGYMTGQNILLDGGAYPGTF
jgi:3-oxoacyl-[acyl-carrier protein] reductase